MIDDDDLTIDGADLMAEILAERQAPLPQPNASSPLPVDDPSGGDAADDPTVTESPLSAVSTVEPSAAVPSTRWSPPPSAVLTVPGAPMVGGMNRLQLGIVAAVFALGIALGAAIGFVRSGDNTVDGQPDVTEDAVAGSSVTDSSETNNAVTE